jgi:hypothetical protein
MILVTRYRDAVVMSIEMPTASHILRLKGNRGLIQPGNFWGCGVRHLTELRKYGTL